MRGLSMALGLALHAAGASAADIYVSPTGSDASGDGSSGKPFATLPKAQLAARKALAALEPKDTPQRKEHGVVKHLNRSAACHPVSNDHVVPCLCGTTLEALLSLT